MKKDTGLLEEVLSVYSKHLQLSTVAAMANHSHVNPIALLLRQIVTPSLPTQSFLCTGHKVVKEPGRTAGQQKSSDGNASSSEEGL